MSTMLANTDVNPNGAAIRRSLTGNLGSHIVVIIQNPQDEILSEYFSLSGPTDVQVRYRSLHTNRD